MARLRRLIFWLSASWSIACVIFMAYEAFVAITGGR